MGVGLDIWGLGVTGEAQRQFSSLQIVAELRQPDRDASHLDTHRISALLRTCVQEVGRVASDGAEGSRPRR